MVAVIHLFSLLYVIPLYEYTTIYFSILFMGICVVSSLGLIMNNVALNIFESFGKHVYWIYLPGVKLLGYNISTCLALVESAKKVSMVVTRTYTFTNNI